MATAKRTKKSTAPKVEAPEVDEDFELEADEAEEAPAPKEKKAAMPAAEKIEFGSQWLAEHVNEQAGTSYDAYNLRILLRKLTKDGVLKREAAEGRARYSFTGPKDPQVVAIIKAVKEGATEKAKQERLDGLKEKRQATKKTKAPKAAKADVEPEAEEEDDFEDIEDI